MKNRRHELFSLSVVVIGEFNPRIFQPSWLASKKLIRESDGVSDSLKIIHPELTIIETEDFRLEVKPSRFEISTTQEAFVEPLRDLCSSIFKLISETTIYAYGINYTNHFRMDDDDDYINFGYHLAPIKKVFSFVNDPRLLEMIVTDRNSELTSNLVHNIKIFSSDLISKNGVGININSHFDIKQDGFNFSKHLSSAWVSTLLKSRKYIEEIWESYK